MTSRNHRDISVRFARLLACALAGLASVVTHAVRTTCAAELTLPRHITREARQAVDRGSEFLARTQQPSGAWSESLVDRSYPVAMTALAGTALLAGGNTPTRGEHAANIDSAARFLVQCSTASGLITSSGEDSGRPMYGHGFSILFLSSVYGMTPDDQLRGEIAATIRAAINLTARAQSPEGGWIYMPGGGDEGSVTVTQVQALRTAQRVGFDVSSETIHSAVRYLERCSTPEGGICYSLSSRTGPRLPISAAAAAALYSAGQYDAPVTERCFQYVWQQFEANPQWAKSSGHDYYANLYGAQAFYMAGDEFWDTYFPRARDLLIDLQLDDDGSWIGDGYGKTYGTAIALVILQLPYQFLPAYQR